MIYIKTISYFFKITLEDKIKQKANISSFDILSEINDLFISHSPANLNQNVPNLDDLDKVYKLLKLLTDEVINDLKDPKLAKTFVESTRNSQSNTYCKLYIQYIENKINSILDNNH